MTDILGQAANALELFAPTLASAFGGPLAGQAVQFIEKATGLEPTGDKDAAAKAILGATPEQMVALQKADIDFKTHLADLGVDIERIAAADRADARKMQAETKSWTPGLLMGGITLGFFGLLGLMAFHGVPEANRDLVNIMLGALAAGWTAGISYFFGSSAGSKTKDDTIQALSR